MKYYLVGILLLISLERSQSQVLKCIHIPVKETFSIKIDGTIEDWNWISKEDYMSSEAMNKTEYAENGESNSWKCKFFSCWSEITNSIYIVAIVEGTLNKNGDVENSQLNDNMILVLNASNSEGEYRLKYRRPYYETIKYCFMPENQMFIMSGPDWLSRRSDFCEYSIKQTRTGDSSEQVIYEIRLSLWDEWSENGVKESKRHILHNDQVIKMTISFNDIKNGIKIADWVTATGDSRYWDTWIDYLSKFELEAPQPSESNWDGIRHVTDY